MSKQLISLLFLVVFLYGCSGGRDVELPENSGTGADEQKPSPCVCNQLEYDGRGFKWLS